MLKLVKLRWLEARTRTSNMYVCCWKKIKHDLKNVLDKTVKCTGTFWHLYCWKSKPETPLCAIRRCSCMFEVPPLKGEGYLMAFTFYMYLHKVYPTLKTINAIMLYYPSLEVPWPFWSKLLYRLSFSSSEIHSMYINVPCTCVGVIWAKILCSQVSCKCKGPFCHPQPGESVESDDSPYPWPKQFACAKMLVRSGMRNWALEKSQLQLFPCFLFVFFLLLLLLPSIRW